MGIVRSGHGFVREKSVPNTCQYLPEGKLRNKAEGVGEWRHSCESPIHLSECCYVKPGETLPH